MCPKENQEKEIGYYKKIKRIEDLSWDGFERAFDKFCVNYKASIIDYMNNFYFDEKGNCYQWEELTDKQKISLAKEGVIIIG